MVLSRGVIFSASEGRVSSYQCTIQTSSNGHHIINGLYVQLCLSQAPGGRRIVSSQETVLATVKQCMVHRSLSHLPLRVFQLEPKMLDSTEE